MEAKFEILSVGVSEHGNSIIRCRSHLGQFIEVATNAIGLARLAAAGCPVNNDRKVNTGKVKGE